MSPCLLSVIADSACFLALPNYLLAFLRRFFAGCGRRGTAEFFADRKACFDISEVKGNNKGNKRSFTLPLVSFWVIICLFRQYRYF